MYGRIHVRVVLTISLILAWLPGAAAQVQRLAIPGGVSFSLGGGGGGFRGDGFGGFSRGGGFSNPIDAYCCDADRDPPADAASGGTYYKYHLNDPPVVVTINGVRQPGNKSFSKVLEQYGLEIMGISSETSDTGFEVRLKRTPRTPNQRLDLQLLDDTFIGTAKTDRRPRLISKLPPHTSSGASKTAAQSKVWNENSANAILFDLKSSKAGHRSSQDVNDDEVNAYIHALGLPDDVSYTEKKTAIEVGADQRDYLHAVGVRSGSDPPQFSLVQFRDDQLYSVFDETGAPIYGGNSTAALLQAVDRVMAERKLPTAVLITRDMPRTRYENVVVEMREEHRRNASAFRIMVVPKGNENHGVDFLLERNVAVESLPGEVLATSEGRYEFSCIVRSRTESTKLNVSSNLKEALSAFLQKFQARTSASSAKTTNLATVVGDIIKELRAMPAFEQADFVTQLKGMQTARWFAPSRGARG